MSAKHSQQIQQLQNANTDSELIKYLNEVLTITMMTMPSAVLSFIKKIFNEHPAFFNIVNQHALHVCFFCTTLVEDFFTANCLTCKN